MKIAKAVIIMGLIGNVAQAEGLSPKADNYFAKMCHTHVDETLFGKQLKGKFRFWPAHVSSTYVYSQVEGKRAAPWDSSDEIEYLFKCEMDAVKYEVVKIQWIRVVEKDE